MSKELKEFIAHARKKGMDHATIRLLLTSAGWKEKDVVEAFSEEGLDMPIPAPSDVGGARDAFHHLLSFAALYTLVISTIVLFFQYINRLFPDPALEVWRSEGQLSAIRWSMAAIIVAFPFLLWMSRIIHREMEKHPEKSWSAIRRWLTYITLFVAASTIGVDIITLIYNLLEGELSTRFLSKVFVVLVAAGLVFTYYFQALKIYDRAKLRLLVRTYLITASVIVTLALVWGVVIVGSPGTQREKNFDERRIEDFQAINREIRNIVYEGREPLRDEDLVPTQPVPMNLKDVKEKAYFAQLDILDPQTEQPYEYLVHSSTAFDLCAEFAHERDERRDIFWNHPAGQHCFSFDVTERRW